MLQNLDGALTREETPLGREFGKDSYGLAMRVAINELDLDLEGFHRKWGGGRRMLTASADTANSTSLINRLSRLVRR
jgi:hypothetical protein